MATRSCASLQWCLSVLWLSVLLHSSTATFSLGFAEDDVSVKETDKIVEIIVATQEMASESVTMEIVPIDIERFRQLGKEVPFDQESATSDADFNATIQRITIRPGHQGDVKVEVEIFDDSISETEEMFAILLRVVEGGDDDGSNVQLLRDTMTVLIRRDSTDAERTVVSFNMASLRMSEGVGVVNSTVFIELEGAAQPPLMVDLQMTTFDGANRDDIILFSTTIVIPPSASRVSVPFQISDDLIYEGDERLQISLSRPANYSQLYRLGYPNTLSLTIQDNDIAHIAMETANNATTLLEGERIQVCVRLLEPSELASFIDLKIVEEAPRVVSSAPHVSVFGDTHFYLYDSYRLHCLTLWASEDDVITPSWTLTFQLVLDPTVYDLVANTSIVLSPEEVQLVVMDNDGIPNTPSDVKVQLINQGKDMLVIWTATSTPLQPVEQYVVEVEGQTTQVIRRQTNIHDDDVRHRYVTTDTEIIVQGIKRGMAYSVIVCAENTIGRTCVEPVMINGSAFVEGPRTGGILLGGSGRGLPVWVYVVSGVVLVVMVAVLACLLGLCFCYRAKKINSYYPSEQENKMNKDTSIKEIYKVTPSSDGGDNSTASTEWELITSSKDFKLNIV